MRIRVPARCRRYEKPRSPDEQRRGDLSYKGYGYAALKDGGYTRSKVALVEAAIM
jgi:hypothetical protein